MNTRPKRSPVRGFRLDLVEEMLRVAAGEKLCLKQKDANSRARRRSPIYAEDPERIPSATGAVRYRPPSSATEGGLPPGLSSAYEGGREHRHYDPMIAKLVHPCAEAAEGIARWAARWTPSPSTAPPNIPSRG